MASLASIKNEFEWSICLEPADNAVESQCCHHVFCEDCSLKNLSNKCPVCRKSPLKFSPNHVVRRVIGNFPAVCENPGCKAEGLTGSTLKGHQATCQFKPTVCPAPACKFSGTAEQFIEHLCSQHKSMLLENASRLFLSATSIVAAMAASATPSAPPSDWQQAYEGPRGDPIAAINVPHVRWGDVDYEARLGSTGKYYCNRRGVVECGCCDGNCGPTTGCNCKNCMRWDIKQRRLPQGYFVNRDGATCRRGASGRFYCGRRVMTHDRATDGYCGPTDGNNCPACQTIGIQVHGMYEGLTMEVSAPAARPIAEAQRPSSSSTPPPRRQHVYK